MLHVTDLLPGDELFCWQRVGYALTTMRHPNKSLYRIVPTRPRVAGPGDLTNYSALVVENDTVRRVLHLETMDMNAQHKSTDSHGTVRASVPYSALSRVQRLSKYHYSGKIPDVRRPTKGYFTRNQAYRTRENVQLR